MVKFQQTTPKAVKTDPALREMVIDAITTLNKPNGTSLQAIKSFLESIHQMFLVFAFAHGEIMQVKCKGKLYHLKNAPRKNLKSQSKFNIMSQ